VPPRKQDGIHFMAETSKGHKFVKVPAYERKQDGNTIDVPAHDGSKQDTSKGNTDK
jgi:hypothetical protein